MKEVPTAYLADQIYLNQDIFFIFSSCQYYFIHVTCTVLHLMATQN